MTFDLKPLPELKLCVNCRHSGEEDYCERVGASQSFARKMKDVCGPYADLFEPVDDEMEQS